jgi:hypothetical protein
VLDIQGISSLVLLLKLPSNSIAEDQALSRTRAVPPPLEEVLKRITAIFSGEETLKRY